MKKQYLFLLLASLFISSSTLAQKRYVTEVFTDVDLTSDVKFGTNIDFLISDFSDQMQVGIDLTAIKTAVFTGQPIPSHFFNPADATSKVKVTDLKMDIYEPKGDTVSKRPVVVYIHTGNFLPPPINGSPTGLKTDSAAIVMCNSLAKRGYVAISVDYRLGWNPIATTVQERRGQLLNAVYRALHDVKKAVRTIRDSAATSNPYSIDSDKIVLLGEGSGGYVALAYETLDKYADMSLPKFTNPLTSSSYIDTLQVGNIAGFGGLLNLYGPSATSTDVQAIVNTGGALADTSWLEQGDAPMIAFQCIRDPFAPFEEGTVIVPTTNEDVVEVQGANLFIKKANALGNNNAIKGMLDGDVYTDAARAKYGVEYDYIYTAPLDKITVSTDAEGLFAFERPIAASLLQNEAGPWQWWNPLSPLATAEVAPGITAHMNSSQSNQDMSATKGRTYQDTILGYMCPRLAVILGYNTPENVSVSKVQLVNGKMYPNPANSNVRISFPTDVRINTITLTDISGKTVLTSENLNSNYAELRVLDLPRGYYFIHAETSKGNWSNKLLKN